MQKPRKLCLARTRHHHHIVAQGFTTGFIKKGNICEEKFGCVAMLFSFRAPLPSNPRMENLLERALFGRVLEDYRPKSLPIQVSAREISFRTELAHELLPDLRVNHKFPRRLVGIKKLGGRANFFQTFAERRLAGRDSASDPNSWRSAVVSDGSCRRSKKS